MDEEVDTDWTQTSRPSYTSIIGLMYPTTYRTRTKEQRQPLYNFMENNGLELALSVE